MSVVARQGFKYSIIGYLGYLLGTVSSLFIFTHDMKFYGQLRFILSTTEIMVPIVVFGISFANVKFFLQAQKSGKHQNLLSLSLLAIFINFLLFIGGFFLINFLFPEFKTSKIWLYKTIILPLILVLSLSAIFNKYISNFKRIVVPNIFENIFPKVANLGAFTLFFFLGLENTALLFFFSMFVMSMIGYAVYANKLEPIKLDFSKDYIKKDHLWKEILSYSFYGFLGNIGNYIAIRIDTYMIGENIDLEAVGIYSTLFAVISLISIPQMGLFNISAPIINKCIAENNFEELDRFHKKTSLSLYFLGAVLFSCILVGFPYLTHFMGNGNLLREAQPVLWILGSAILVDLATGFNGNIISLSKYYRFNIIIMLILAALTIALNYYFIFQTSWGIVGVAFATAISLLIYNLTKIIFNFVKFKIHPLSIEMIFVSILCTLAITVSILLPDFKNPIFNLIYKPFCVVLMIGIGNYFLKIYSLDKFLNKEFFKSLFKF
ncbi:MULTISPECIES: lipopolysaccharide biosynthesis protein [Amniculibacterium]|uniref:lipopolysaccharide biosynthesis protein n=1 Tax=Amniculibacterium TaxID=2715289 RepID=UPI000F5AFAC3|nr:MULTISPECIES: oligosaccharide flippase family protein [Amniculibacterium]